MTKTNKEYNAARKTTTTCITKEVKAGLKAASELNNTTLREEVDHAANTRTAKLLFDEATTIKESIPGAIQVVKDFLPHMTNPEDFEDVLSEYCIKNPLKDLAAKGKELLEAELATQTLIQDIIDRYDDDTLTKTDISYIMPGFRSANTYLEDLLAWNASLLAILNIF